jgi:hypothetical protein
MIAVEIARGEWGARKQVYDVEIHAWRFWLAKAREHGWNSEGAKPDDSNPQTPADYSKFFASDYEPREWCYAKKVTALDALNLAHALDRYLKSDINLAPINRSLVTHFIDFLNGGEFVFAIWDE